MIQLVIVFAIPSGICLPILRLGENISGRGLDGLEGDVGGAGRIKCGRAAGVDNVDAAVSART